MAKSRFVTPSPLISHTLTVVYAILSLEKLYTYIQDLISCKRKKKYVYISEFYIMPKP